MTKNSAAKRATRARQSATGAPYMEARRQAEAKQWLIQLGTYRVSQRQPMPFVVDTRGETYGNIDPGIAVGFVDHPDSHDFKMLWHDLAAADEAERAVGWFLVARDRFTGRWTTFATPVEAVAAPASAAARSALWGGDQAPTVDEVRRIARRRLHHRRGTGWDVAFSAALKTEAGEQVRDWEVGTDAVLRDAETGEAMGTVEAYSADPATAALTWAMPALADGLVPVVWSDEFSRLPLGAVTDVRASSVG